MGVFLLQQTRRWLRESGMPFELLLTQFALNILLQANLDNDQKVVNENALFFLVTAPNVIPTRVQGMMSVYD